MNERVNLPVLPLRETVVFPGVTAPIVAGRDKTLRAIDKALGSDSEEDAEVIYEGYAPHGVAVVGQCRDQQFVEDPVLLADQLAGYDRERMMNDMDAWGYSFRLGSTQAWVERDAEDARTAGHDRGQVLGRSRHRHFHHDCDVDQHPRSRGGENAKGNGSPGVGQVPRQADSRRHSGEGRNISTQRVERPQGGPKGERSEYPETR